MENKLEDRKINKPEDTESIDNKPPKDKPSGMEQGFKEALSYFGPRLATLILGGTEAMKVADQVLTGYEATRQRRIDEQARIAQAEAEQKRAVAKEGREERALKVREKGSKLREKELKMAEKKVLVDAGKYEKDTYNKYKKEFGSREDIKEYRKFAGVMSNIENMVEEGKKIPEASYALIARGLSGEVGVLTDPDIERAKVNRSILEQVRTGFYKTFKGTLAPEDRAEILKIARLVRSKKNEEFSRIATEQAKLDSETLSPKYQDMMRRNYLGQIYIFDDKGPEEQKQEQGPSEEEKDNALIDKYL
jgi:hypothetical protein